MWDYAGDYHLAEGEPDDRTFRGDVLYALGLVDG